MIFPCDLTDDPLVARSDRLLRWGGFVPMGGFCLIGLTGHLVRPTRVEFIAAMLILSLMGQLLVWAGIRGLWRSRGWDQGVMFFVWAGGLLNVMAAASTAIFVLVPIPLIAPLVATVARWRMRRGGAVGGGGG